MYSWVKIKTTTNACNDDASQAYEVCHSPEWADLQVQCDRYTERCFRAWVKSGILSPAQERILWLICELCEIRSTKLPAGVSRNGIDLPHRLIKQVIPAYSKHPKNINKVLGQLEHAGAITYIRGAWDSLHGAKFSPVAIVHPPSGISMDDLRCKESTTHRLEVLWDAEEIASSE